MRASYYIYSNALHMSLSKCDLGVHAWTCKAVYHRAGSLYGRGVLMHDVYTLSRLCSTCMLACCGPRSDRAPDLQEGGGKPVSDQWLPPFVIVDDAGKPVGTIEVCDTLWPNLLMWRALVFPTRGAAAENSSGCWLVGLRQASSDTLASLLNALGEQPAESIGVTAMGWAGYEQQVWRKLGPSLACRQTVVADCETYAGQDGDAVAIFNFRSDRVIEISKAFEYEDFTAFDRKRFPKARPPALRAHPILNLCMRVMRRTTADSHWTLRWGAVAL